MQSSIPSYHPPNVPSQALVDHLVARTAPDGTNVQVFQYSLERCQPTAYYSIQDHPLLINQAQKVLAEDYFQSLLHALDRQVPARDFMDLVNYINSLAASKPIV